MLRHGSSAHGPVRREAVLQPLTLEEEEEEDEEARVEEVRRDGVFLTLLACLSML